MQKVSIFTRALLVGAASFAYTSLEAAETVCFKLNPESSPGVRAKALNSDFEIVAAYPEVGIYFGTPKVGTAGVKAAAISGRYAFVESGITWQALAGKKPLPPSDPPPVVNPTPTPDTVGISPNDPSFSSQEGLVRLKVPLAWRDTRGKTEIVIATTDTGIDYNHSDLKHQVWTNRKEIPGNGIDDDGNGFVDDVHGWDFVKGDNDPLDGNKHGSHVAGIIGAEGNNGVGMAGINWNVQIMPLQMMSASGSGTNQAAIESIIYAVRNGAKVINASWGGPQFSQCLREAIQYAADQGVLFVAAAGNDGKETDFDLMYPAGFSLPNIVAVASSDSNGKLSSFSNFGMIRTDLAAPGLNIFSTVPGSAYARLSGTSMATPMVSGVAGLILSLKPDLSMIDLRNALYNATDVYSGYKNLLATEGELNAQRAVDQMSQGFQVWPQRMHLQAGFTFQFTAYGAQGSVQWASSNPSVASIDQNGLLTPVAARGDVQITARDSSTGLTRSTQWVRIGQ